MSERVSRWSPYPLPIFDGGVVRVYVKLERNPALEKLPASSDKTASENVKSAVDEKREVPMVPVKPSVDADTAELVTNALIESVSARGVRELLQDAKWFAGSSVLGGNRPVRSNRPTVFHSN